jgi:hypothetical protein
MELKIHKFSNNVRNCSSIASYILEKSLTQHGNNSLQHATKRHTLIVSYLSEQNQDTKTVFPISKTKN